jgi:hypothetical protein
VRPSILLLVAPLLGTGCYTPAPEPPAGDVATAAAQASPPPRLENRVWARVDSAGSPTGELYAFLAEGTLVIASPSGTPLVGSWSRDGGGIVLVEDGQRHETDVVRLEPGELVLRSHHPGGTLDLRFVPADSSHP